MAPWVSVILYGNIGSWIKTHMLTRSRSCKLVACEMDAFRGV
jgi:hypothetical protein